MRRVLIYPVLCVSLAAGAAGCSRDADRSPDASNTAANRERASGGDASADKLVEVTGCLTSNAESNQFVLTANANALTSMTSRAAAGEAETFHYQLVGGTDLQSHVGREVIIKGSVQGDGRDVDIEADHKVETPGSKRRDEDATPAVESAEQIEMQVERLHVASVTPTGSACQIGQGERR